MKKNKNKLNAALGLIIVIIFAIIFFNGINFFEIIEKHFYDAGTKFAGAEYQFNDDIIIIKIDKKSIEELGSWPWSGHVVGDMLDLLNEKGTGLIGLNILFDEVYGADDGLREVKAFREKFKAYPLSNNNITLKNWVLDTLEQIEDRLDDKASILKSFKTGKNILLPISTNAPAYKNNNLNQEYPFLEENSLDSSNIPSSFKDEILVNEIAFPSLDLVRNSAGLGHDKLVSGWIMGGRSHPVYLYYKNSLIPSLPLRLAIAYFDQHPGQVYADENQVILDNRKIPLHRGEMLMNFSGHKDVFREFSFSDVLGNDEILPDLKGKIVIIGHNRSENEGYGIPLFSDMAEPLFIAHVLENILSFNPITRPSYMPYIEILLLFVLGIFATFFFPYKTQSAGLIWLACIILLSFSTVIFLFAFAGIWFKPVYFLSCLIVLYLCFLAKDLLFATEHASESNETSRLLGLSFQSQGLLDLAFDKFRKLPLNNETKDLLYNLGIEYENKRLTNKALEIYEYINRGKSYRDLDDRIPRLKALDESSTLGGYERSKEATLVTDPGEVDRSMVGRYKILSELGKGSMGLVYKAQDPKINRLVAIKTICFSDEFEEDVIQEIKGRFFREAEIAGQLSHPSIVIIHDVGDDQDLTYMAMEYLEGENLDKYTRKGNLLPLRRVLKVVGDIAEALDFAHKKEVIHRDIKPANVMLLKDGKLKVTDFGIAKAISSSRTKTGIILGTPNYMSPEQIMGQKIDYRSDIFSLGVLFYQLVTGELPFHGEDLSSLLYQITQVEHPSPLSYNAKLPKIFEKILGKALAKDPDKRFRSAGDMARVVRALGEKMDEIKRRRQHKK